jgi:F0F1-type ATP synthase assembly protein I
MSSTPKPSRRAASDKANEAAETQLGWRMAGLAFLLSSEVAAGALIGWGVDHFAHTQPKGLMYGAIAGICVGMLSFIRGGLALNRLVTRNEAQRGLPPPLKPSPPDAENRVGSTTEDTEDTERD